MPAEGFAEVTKNLPPEIWKMARQRAYSMALDAYVRYVNAISAQWRAGALHQNEISEWVPVPEGRKRHHASRTQIL